MNSKRTTFFLGLACFIIAIGMPYRALSVVISPSNAAVNETSDCVINLFAPLQLTDLAVMSRKDVEKKLDKRLTFRERQSLRILKRHAKRIDGFELSNDDCAAINKKASNAVIWGIVGLLIAGLIFGIIAISMGSKAKRMAIANPDCPDAEKMRKKGNTAVVLGVIDIIGALIVLALL